MNNHLRSSAIISEICEKNTINNETNTTHISPNK